jgi:hypothetical protein
MPNLFPPPERTPLFGEPIGNSAATSALPVRIRLAGQRPSGLPSVTSSPLRVKPPELFARKPCVPQGRPVFSAVGTLHPSMLMAPQPCLSTLATTVASDKGFLIIVIVITILTYQKGFRLNPDALPGGHAAEQGSSLHSGDRPAAPPYPSAASTRCPALKGA